MEQEDRGNLEISVASFKIQLAVKKMKDENSQLTTHNSQLTLRRLPQVQKLLEHKSAQDLISRFSRKQAVNSIRDELQSIREKVKGCNGNLSFSETDFFVAVEERCRKFSQPCLRRVINATGIVLHTNLGRAPLPPKAAETAFEIAAHYSNLEYNLEKGERGSRLDHVESLLCRLTGSEAALVVNNNAAALLLILNTLAENKEVIISRGQLIEIGGSFRIPEVIKKSGACLVEVGTTNKTKLSDFKTAITENTRALLSAHTSNYRVVGFVQEVSLEELAVLGHKKRVPVVHDLGSGAIVDLSQHGLPYEPTPQSSLKSGCDVVAFSGDKLLGGPQAGIVLGRKKLLEKMRRNSLLRAVRIDKMCLAALEATLRFYLQETHAKTIPVLCMLTQTTQQLALKARRLASEIQKNASIQAEVHVQDGESRSGGGSLPEEGLATKLVKISPKTLSVNVLEEKLRFGNPPVIGRIHKGSYVLDVRTLTDEDVIEIVKIFSLL